MDKNVTQNVDITKNVKTKSFSRFSGEIQFHFLIQYKEG